MPGTWIEATLLAFADHGTLDGVLPADGGDADETPAAFERGGIDLEAVAAQLQRAGAES